ncbi:BRO-N domain-containing protein, partial [Magnetococcales bacterium HHB-1]
MADNIIPFQFEGKPIRVVTDNNGTSYFVAKDVCDVLEISNPRNAYARLNEADVRTMDVRSGNQMRQMKSVNESGLYDIVFESRKPQARRFRHWVTSEVLPSIRKTGKYEMPSQSVAVDSLVKPAQEYRAAISVAKLFFDGNQALIAANRATKQITGVDLMDMMGATHLIADKQEVLLTATEVGKRINLSSRKINPFLESLGLLDGFR